MFAPLAMLLACTMMSAPRSLAIEDAPHQLAELKQTGADGAVSQHVRAETVQHAIHKHALLDLQCKHSLWDTGMDWVAVSGVRVSSDT